MTTKIRTLAAASLAVMLALTTWQCTKKPAAPDRDADKDFPSQPFGLTISTGDRQIELTWSVDNTVQIRSFRIYRRDTSMASFAFLDSSLVRRYVDTRVRNGATYYYQVSAVSRKGAEGLRSSTIYGVPNVYTLRIAAGVEYTATRQVTLTISAPPGTDYMLLGNDTSFTNSSWQPFENQVPWTLSPGDGIKTVHAKFRDRDGNETKNRISDSIILDTIALIQELTEDTGGLPKQVDQFVRFVMKTNEAGGAARVSLANGPQNLVLFDDGIHGDDLANDGTYQLSYQIPDDLELTQAKVLGNFTDRVGNVAATVTAPGKLTVLKAPEPVTLFQPTLVGSQQNTLRLAWSASQETDFANYSIYRSRSRIFTAHDSLLVDRVTVQQTTSYNDGNLEPGVDYFYQVLVFDTGGLKSRPSNEVTGRLSANQPPSAVVVNTPVLLGDGTSEVQLTWSRSTDADFASYRLFRSTKLPVDSTGSPLISYASANNTIHVDNTVSANTTYYYRVFVYDQGGKRTGSNTVSITTARNQPPRPVTLAMPVAADTSTLILSWSQNNDTDFASYRIYRSRTPGIVENQTPIFIINDARETTYTDIGLRSKTTYYYRVFVYDRGDLSSGSNEVMGTTR